MNTYASPLVFPFSRIPKGSRIYIYGAGQIIGFSFLRMIYDNPSSEIYVVGFLDKDPTNAPSYFGLPTYEPEKALETEGYDLIVIASQEHMNAMVDKLLTLGIPNERIIKTAISSDDTANNPLERIFIQFFEQVDLESQDILEQNLLFYLNEYRSLNFYTQQDEMAKAISIYCKHFRGKAYSRQHVWYGHGNALLRYCGISMPSDLMPSIEHGLHQIPRAYPAILKEYKPSIIATSPFRQENIRHSTKTPVFTIGPYLAYADICMSQNEYDEMRKRLGKNLLLYPHHSWYPTAETFVKKDEFEDFFMELKKGFDSVTACIYCAHYDQDTINYYKKLGIHAVTTGIPFDHRFIDRQKLLIDLSDAIVTDELGTSLGYFIRSQKPVYYYHREINQPLMQPLGKNYESALLVRDTLRKVKEGFGTSGVPPSVETMEVCNHVYGLNKVRSAEEIRAMFEINEDINKRSFGDAILMPDETQRLLDELSHQHTHEDAVKYKLLLEALK
ncbi:MAG: hypothetical protein FWB88_09040 [Defluviitaleaceae bacterium]|nr:hypothetical protein [Defluviitaleaceae bacterium]MCL2239576.1 hypothetical protein [Defluviitaleaceae bacterium]